MTASIKEKQKIKEKLPHELLRAIYLDSRVSVKKLSEEWKISHHTISKCLKECEERYKLLYTVEVDTDLLGLSEARILAIKFEKIPDLDLLRKTFENDTFVQNAYLGSGDFDLILHVIGLDHVQFSYWCYKFRLSFCRYKPKVKVVTLDNINEGFMPVSTKLVNMSKGLSDIEKKLLIKLIENSRIKIKDLAKSIKISQMKAIYLIDKLQKRGIIKRFTTCIENPDKRIFLFYAVTLMPNEGHHPKLLLAFLDKIIGEENSTQSVTDYSVYCETSGYFDIVFFCNFKDGKILNERGPNFLKSVWQSESPVVEQCILTELITGIWPFNTNNYVRWSVGREKEKTYLTKPVPIEIY